MNIHHVHAYTTSIINVILGKPYNEVICNIYGHYGIILGSLVKLFGNNLFAIILILSILTFLIYMLAAYILDNLIEYDWLYFTAFLAVFGLAVTYFGGGMYYQGCPHRILFPVMVLAEIIWLNKRHINCVLKYLIIIITGVLSLIFNTETGFVCLAIFSAEVFFRDFDKKYISQKVGLIALICISSFFIAYASVNFYNLSVGGGIISLTTFLYPLTSSLYITRITSTALYFPFFTGYLLHNVIFALTAFEMMYVIVRYNQHDSQLLIRLAISVAGLGCLSYFMNREAFGNLFISHTYMIILLAVYSQKYLREKEQKKFSLSLLSLFLLIFFAIESVISIPHVFYSRYNGAWRADTIRQDFENYSKWMPSNDVKAFGIGIPELYFQLGKDTGIYTSEWSSLPEWWDDMVSPSYYVVESIAKQEKEILISGFTTIRVDVKNMLSNDHYVLTDKFEGNNFSVLYFTK